jgi:diacylglycerol kinase family enzyme
VGGVGLDAIVVRRREPAHRGRRQFAMGTYFADAVWSAVDWHGVDLVARSDGEVLRGRYLLAVITNIRAYGGGLVTLAPEARVDDGWLDLWLFAGRTFAETRSTRGHYSRAGTSRPTYSVRSVAAPEADHPPACS